MKSDTVCTNILKRDTQKDTAHITSMFAKSVVGHRWVLWSQPAELSNMSVSSCDNGLFFGRGITTIITKGPLTT